MSDDTITETEPEPAEPSEAEPVIQPRTQRRLGDPIFRWIATSAGVTILATLGLVFLFLLIEGAAALEPGNQELIGEGGDEGEGEGFFEFVLPLLYGTALAAIVALVLATPLAIGIALFISHYAPRRIASILGYLIDLLAAVPSIVFGLWGISVLAPYLVPSYSWLNENLGWIPLFSGTVLQSGRSMATVGVVLAVMILPIMTAVAREAFLQTPRLHEEAALALGATKWEMIKMAVLPYGRGGVISGAMLGLGRALGETLAIAVVLSVSPGIFGYQLFTSQNSSTIAANVALNFPESTGIEVNALIATGLVLFVVTFFVNYLARLATSRRSSEAA